MKRKATVNIRPRLVKGEGGGTQRLKNRSMTSSCSINMDTCEHLRVTADASSTDGLLQGRSGGGQSRRAYPMIFANVAYRTTHELAARTREGSRQRILTIVDSPDVHLNSS